MSEGQGERRMGLGGAGRKGRRVEEGERRKTNKRTWREKMKEV